MSEFTAGNLILHSNKQALTEYQPKYIEELNDNWIVFMTEDTYVSDGVPESIFAISEKIPVLYFYNFEDHGWGYSIVHQSEITACLNVSYETEFTLLVHLAAERYPEEEDPIELIFSPEGNAILEELTLELQRSDQLAVALDKQFENRNVDQFKLFQVSDEQIDRLAAILHTEYFISAKHQLVEEFKDILNLTEMSWIRADRV